MKVKFPVSLLILSVLCCSVLGQKSIKTEVTFEHEKNSGVNEYTPSQNVPAFPERLKEGIVKRTGAVYDLAPYKMKPIEGGMAYIEPKDQGVYEIHHRRAGVACEPGAVYRFRMETKSYFASVMLGIMEGDKFAPFNTFSKGDYEIYPGRVVQRFASDKYGIEVEVETVSPASLPAYGLMSKVTILNKGNSGKDIEPAAVCVKGTNTNVPVSKPERAEKLVVDVPLENIPVRHGNKVTNQLIMHDTDYDILAGFERAGIKYGDNIITREISLGGGEEESVNFAAIIDSDYYDKEALDRVREYFSRNTNLPESVRKDMIAQAKNTFIDIAVNGFKSFKEFKKDAGKAFKESKELWDKGIYREREVEFEFDDKMLESFCNLTVNDHFSGLVQPPGLVHDSKYGDAWNYIFCYRHVHAASDFGFEDEALNYLRLLSCNQKKSGLIASVRADFDTDAHPTKFDASYIDSLWHYYKWTGDKEGLKQLWPTVVGALKWLDSSQDPDGDLLYRDFLNQWKSDYDDRGPSSSFQTAIVRKAYSDAAKMAEVLGKKSDAEKYEKKAEAIYKKAQSELWSGKHAMMGPKGPLGMLRLHPQSLEVEIPVWTKLADPYQAQMLVDWYIHHNAMYDEDGGIWMCDNDWWPAAWSQHVPAPGNYLMIGWASFLTGRYEVGENIVKTVCRGSYRGNAPGFDYIFGPKGSMTTNDPGTVQGAWGRALIEGLFGVRPEVDKGYYVIRPGFSSIKKAGYEREGLVIKWNAGSGSKQLDVETDENEYAVLEIPIEPGVEIEKVRLNGKKINYEILPEMGKLIVQVRTEKGGGKVDVKYSTIADEIYSVSDNFLHEGQIATVDLKGVDYYSIDDRFDFFRVMQKKDDTFEVKLLKKGCGRAALFLNCKRGDVEWIQPIFFDTIKGKAVDNVERTVVEVIEDEDKLVTVDLDGFYNKDIQRVFETKWKQDSQDSIHQTLGYWSRTLFKLTEDLPKDIKVGQVPFKIGRMGPSYEDSNDLIFISNTEPRELPSGFEVDLGKRHLQKIYLLSFNLNIPQKCYVPAVRVRVKYGDGSEEVTKLTPPINFDNYQQDFGINTVAYHLKTEPGYGVPFTAPFNFEMDQHHLTMTDIICDPDKKVKSVKFESVATETFFGLAGMTVLEN